MHEEERVTALLALLTHINFKLEKKKSFFLTNQVGFRFLRKVYLYDFNVLV